MTFAGIEPYKNVFKKSDPDPDLPEQIKFEGLMKFNGQFVKTILYALGDVVEIQISNRGQGLLQQELLLEDLLNHKLTGVWTEDRNLIAKFEAPKL